MWESLQHAYALRALISASLVGITCGILGCFVILRKMALIGDALSHAILPGVVFGYILFGQNPLAIFAGAVFAGLLTTVIITWIQRNSSTKDDASVGIVFTAMFAIGIMSISWLSKNEGVHLDMKDFLFGNVLGVSDSDLYLTFVIFLYIVLCFILFYHYFFITTFDPLIARTMGISVAVFHYFFMFLLSLTVVASIQSVGVILVVSMLIIPSSTAYLLTNRLWIMLIISALMGLISASGGFILAVVYQTTPGPAMTLVASGMFVMALLFAPGKGYVLRTYIKMQRRFISDQQDIIKAIEKYTRKNTDAHTIREEMVHGLCPQHGKIGFRIHIWVLQKMGFIEKNRDYIRLSAKGRHEAEVLIRAHRIWESYLVQKMNVPMDQIHDSAERMEHVLPKEFIDKVEHDLGYPLIDPHGSPIPKLKKKKVKLSDLKQGSYGVISEDQSQAVKDLWQLGIFPNSEFVVIENGADTVTIQIKSAIFAIKKEQAKRINIHT